MRTNFFLIAVIAICFVTESKAQQKFNVQNGTKTAFYNDLETAVQQAAAGDTIYLPGITIQLQEDLVIDKKLALIGVGWDMDSIGGQHLTILDNGGVKFSEGSDGSLITGCQLGSIVSENVSDIIILRNNIGTINLNESNNINIWENNNAWISGNNTSGCFIENNKVSGGINYLRNSFIINNVIGGNISGSLCIFENNFIAGSHGENGNNTFNNNAFRGNYTFPAGTDIGENNLMNQSDADTFVGENINDIPKNLQLKPSSPCKTAGMYGTEIGIYGGTRPYKAGALPFNPHVSKSVISTRTDAEGKLSVEIVVTAQDR
ncbi:hypothetical protein AGMMS50239_21850 [Bacteroidia bacterium]|nr:hypothetical protein AGMMS50239_21850 [Bacteroidia bacterium]